MFGIGAPEMMLLALIAMLVVGPERLPGIMRDVGRTVADLRRTSDELRDQFLNVDLEAIAAAKPKETPYEREEREARERIRAAAELEALGAAAPLARSEPDELPFDRELREARERLAAGAGDQPAG